MLSRAKVGFGLAATLLAFVALTMATPSYGYSKKEAMAACRAKYGKGITDVIFKKNGQIVCQEGPRNPTRQQVYDYCKKEYSAQTVWVRKLANGKWECRYYGRY
jgi:hypothetical protein